MKIRKLPSGSYTTQVQVGGVRKSFTSKSKTELKKKVAEYRLSASDAPCAPLGVLIDNYIDSRWNVLSPSTVERYERVRKHYFQRLMTVPAREITAERMQREINLMAVKYAPKTVRNGWGLLSSTFRANGMPMSVTLPKKKLAVYHLPIEAQVWIMIDQASENLKTAILLAAFCSLRRSEIVALHSDDIEGNMIHIHRAGVYGPGHKYIIKELPKVDASDRYIQAPDVVIDQIKDKDGLVCPIKPSAVTASFIRLRNKLGLTCRFHDLRHFYASLQHAIGIKDQYIQKSGGWKSDAMLKMIYRNTLEDVEKDVADKFNDHLKLKQSANEMQTEGEFSA